MSLIHETMPVIMAEIGAIGKDEKNKQQGFNFRGIDTIYNQMHGILTKHKVFTTSEVLNCERHEKATKSGGVLLYSIITMRYTFWASDGSSVISEVVGEGMDSGDKASNKAMAIAHKYCLLQAFCTPTKEVKDPDANTPEALEPEYDTELLGNMLTEVDKCTNKDALSKWKAANRGRAGQLNEVDKAKLNSNVDQYMDIFAKEAESGTK